MREITFVTKLFNHDSRYGFYIPRSVVVFHELLARRLKEGLSLVYKNPLPTRYNTYTSHAYDYPQRGTIRVFFSDFEDVLEPGMVVEVTMKADVPDLPSHSQGW
jgi:hypothetical protein